MPGKPRPSLIENSQSAVSGAALPVSNVILDATTRALRDTKARGPSCPIERSFLPLLFGERETLLEEIGHAHPLGHGKPFEFLLEFWTDFEVERNPLLGLGAGRARKRIV